MVIGGRWRWHDQTGEGMDQLISNVIAKWRRFLEGIANGHLMEEETALRGLWSDIEARGWISRTAVGVNRLKV